MAGIRSRVLQALQPMRDILRVQFRTLVPVGLTVLIGLLVVIVLGLAYAGIVGVTAYQSLIASVASVNTWTLAGVLLLVPVLVLGLLASLTWAGTVTQAASSALDKKRAGMPSAVARSLRRAPRAFAVFVVIIAAFLGAIIAAPVFLVVGLVGLITKRGDRSRNIAMAIPFGVAVLALVRWSLAPAALWLDDLTLRAALRESSRRVRGRGPQTAATLIVATLVSVGITELSVAWITDPSIQLAVRVAALVVVGALPFVAGAVLYRRASDAPPKESLPAPITWRARVAATVSITLVLPLIVAVAPGAVANADAGTTVTVTSGANESLTHFNAALDIVVTGSAPTGEVQVEAISPAGASIDMGAVPLDPTGQTQANVGSALPAGTYQFIAHYTGDAGNPAADSAPFTFTFRDRMANIAVASTPGGSGDTAIVTTTLTPGPLTAGTPGGTVTLTGGGSTWGPTAVDGAGAATFMVDLAALGTRDLLVSYNGDGSYLPGSAPYTVPRLAVSMNVFGDTVRTISYGDAQVFAGTVSTTVGTTPTGSVELWWNGAAVASGTLTAGAFSVSTDELRVGNGVVTLRYTGDSSHDVLDDSSVSLSVAKTTTDPIVTYSPTPAEVGDSGTLTASFADIGAGPTGDVTFTDSTGLTLGTATISGGVATLAWSPTYTATLVSATYGGDANFTGGTVGGLSIAAAKATVTVAIADPGPVTIGDRFLLVANVKVGAANIPPIHTVDFVTSDGTVLKSGVSINPASGNASVWFCAAGTVATGCMAGDVMLTATDLDIVARYDSTSVNNVGEDTYEYRPSKPLTTTVLEVTPTNVLFGSGVHLKATVTSPGNTPTGFVTFSATNPDGSFTPIKSVALTAGVAEWDTQSGTGLGDLVWPQNAVHAEYDPNGASFQLSADDEAITLGRVGTSITVGPVSPDAGVRTLVTASLSHDPGASEDYDGEVTLTSDTGETCTSGLAVGVRAVSCNFTWATTGAHTITASYSGDSAYLPTGPTVTPVNVGTFVRTPVLGVSAPSSALVGDDVTVTWGLTDVSMTGTVLVVADGSVWCTVAVATQTCTGRFPIGTSGLVDIEVSYLGDANWNPVSERWPLSVTRCAILDVRSNSTSLGTVHIDTAPNCGATGYSPGTVVSVTATPIAPAEFGYWTGYRPPAPDMVLVDSNPTTRWVVTSDDQTWVRVAQFRIPCSTVTAAVTGNGTINVYPASNCRTPGGEDGYLYGTPVTIYPSEQRSSYYEELDAFYSFGRLPSGATAGTDRFGRPVVRLFVSEPAVIPVTFGPVCRVPNIVFDPASDGDHVDVEPAPNCHSPAGDGYLRFTTVTAHAESGDPSMAITGWTIDGAPAPELGASADLTVEIDTPEHAYTATTVHCWSVDVDIDGVTDRSNMLTGAVRIDGTKCPDDSDRYVDGTEVTLTPQALAAGTLFNGWDEARIKAVKPDTGDKGDITQAARTFVIDRDIHTTAGFFDQSACSPLTNVGSPGLLTFEFTGCGPGSYLDFRKQQAAMQGVPVDDLVGGKWLSDLQIDVHKTGPLDVYVTVNAESPDCGQGWIDQDGFSALGPRSGRVTCRVSGPVMVDASVCQKVVTDPVFTVAGQPGVTYGRDSMPNTFYVPGPGGLVSAISDYHWGQAVPVTPDGTVPVTPDSEQKYRLIATSGPCDATENLFAPKTDLLVYASAPSQGFRFNGWTDGSTPVEQTPIHKKTNADTRTLSGSAAYGVACHTVTFGEGIHVVGDAPRCPGSSEADNSFIFGMAIQIRADYLVGDRNIEKFTSGVGADQIWQDPATLDYYGFAVVGVGTKVTALYQNSTQRTNTEIIKGLKFGAGIVAVVGPVVLGMLVPPLGIFFAVMGTVAGISKFLPNGQGASALFDMLNPTKITACIARWGFTNAGSPGNQGNYGSMISTGKTTLQAVLTNKDLLTRDIGAFGIAGAAASIGYGLYDAGIGGANLVGPQSVEELAGKSTLEGCLADVWRLAMVGQRGGLAG